MSGVDQSQRTWGGTPARAQSSICTMLSWLSYGPINSPSRSWRQPIRGEHSGPITGHLAQVEGALEVAEHGYLPLQLLHGGHGLGDQVLANQR